MIIRFLYDFALHLFVLFSLPKVFWGMLRRGKYRKSFWYRLGFGFPEIEKENSPLIWVHAVSLGETRAIAPLVKKLKEASFAPKILLTTATETGFQEGKKTLPQADYHHYLPLDFPYVIKSLIRRIAPDLLVLVESDFWLNFQDAFKKRGAKCVLVNGKLSMTSYQRWKRFPLFAKALFSSFDLMCLQGEMYKKRFSDFVTPHKLQVTGNIKCDGLFQLPLFSRKERGLEEEDLVLTLGSTHAPEERLFLDAYVALKEMFPRLKLFIAPRHPERFLEVAKLLERYRIDYASLSSGVTKEVMLVDKMGVLRTLYAMSDVAFVGGSFVAKVGGHNILEPSVYGVPVVYGPYMHSQPDFVRMMEDYGGGIQIDEKTLFPTLQKLLASKDQRKSLGEKGKRLTEEGRGALERTYSEILNLLCV